LTHISHDVGLAAAKAKYAEWCSAALAAHAKQLRVSKIPAKQLEVVKVS